VRNEAVRAGRPISRIALAYEAGRDGFLIHSASVAVSRERKRAKTDRLDAAMLMRVFLGWLRGERGHCGMVAIPTMEEEDALIDQILGAAKWSLGSPWSSRASNSQLSPSIA
jgi:transposase